jgi:hypothetical protein
MVLSWVVSSIMSEIGEGSLKRGEVKICNEPNSNSNCSDWQIFVNESGPRAKYRAFGSGS